MAMKPLVLLALLPLTSLAQMSSAERAMILNQEMDFLMQAAPKAETYAAPSASATPDFRQRRNGIAPSQMPGVERAEDRYFSDEVTFKAAAADRISDDQENENDMRAYDEQAEEDGFSMDGTLRKRRSN